MTSRTRQSFILAAAAMVLSIVPAVAASDKTGGPWKLGDIVVEQAWARLAPGGSRTGAVYLTIHNKSSSDDLLLAVDSSVAQTTAVHESKIVDGVATMEPLPLGVQMQSHNEVVMRPGGLHIMLTGLSADLKPGLSLPVRMVFQEAGSLDLEVPILPLSAPDPSVKHSGHGD